VEWEDVTSSIEASSAKERLRNLVPGHNVISHLERATAFKLIRIVPLQITPVKRMSIHIYYHTELRFRRGDEANEIQLQSASKYSSLVPPDSLLSGGY
jgi:hypothetical protein